MIFETPHVLSSYSNVSLMRHELSLHTFTLDPSLSTWEKYWFPSVREPLLLFLGWCQCGCRNVIQAVRDRKEVSYISQEFCDNFCMLRKVFLNLPSTGQNGPPTVYIKTMVYISNPRNHDLKLDFLCVRGILNWLVCRASEQTYVSILHP